MIETSKPATNRPFPWRKLLTLASLYLAAIVLLALLLMYLLSIAGEHAVRAM